MRIALIDVDGHPVKKKWGGTVYPNLALAKIAAYHSHLGHSVEWYDPLQASADPYDIVYMSKVFNFTPDYPFPVLAKEIVRGGTGYDIHSSLPQDIDDTQPDMSIYPHVPQDTAYGFLTRGCPNKCPWCVVPRKEGRIRPYWDVDRVANGRKKLVLMDNNILAAGSYAIEQLDKIILRGYHVDFNQALDARLVTPEFSERLAKIKWIHSRIRFGCDTTSQIRECEHAMDLIQHYGFRGEFFLYTMIGGKNDFSECYHRVNYWWKQMMHHRYRKENSEYLDIQFDNYDEEDWYKIPYETAPVGYNVYAYAQPYRDPTKPHHIIPQWQKDLAQWCNKRMLFCSTSFADFSPRKGFTCREYLKEYEIREERLGFCMEWWYDR